MLISHLPGRIGVALRYSYWKKNLKYLGNNVIIDTDVHFQNPDFISIDDNSWIDKHVIILAGPPFEGRITYEKENPDFHMEKGEVFIGKSCHIAPNCVLSGIGGLYIGINTTIATGSAIYSFSHHYRNLSNLEDVHQYSFTSMARHDQQSMILGPVVIGDYSAIGLNSVILPGTNLKKGCWVASGSVIKGSFPEQTLIYSNREIYTKSISDLQIKE